MLKVLLASCKGGSGKTTLATHLAAHYAVDGKNTVLVDCDRLGSSRHWCERRAGLASAVLPIDGTKRNWRERLPDGVDRIVIDTAAGISAARSPPASSATASSPGPRPARPRWSRCSSSPCR